MTASRRGLSGLSITHSASTMTGAGVEVYPDNEADRNAQNESHPDHFDFYSRGSVRSIQESIQTSLEGFRLLLRVLALIVALVYVLVSVASVFAATSVLRGQEGHVLTPEVFRTNLMSTVVGSGRIADSPLVRQILGGSISTNRTDAVYLETSSKHSFTGCSSVAGYNKKLYGSTYMRYMFDQIKVQLAYNEPMLTDLELIVPIVDCSFGSLVVVDNSCSKVFYLVRHRNSSNLMLLSSSFSIQNYYITAHHRHGPALLLSIAFIEDMRVLNVDYRYAIALNYPYELQPLFVACDFVEKTKNGFWVLQDIPVNPMTEDSREILTAYRTGFYIDDPVSQSNIKSWNWEQFHHDPASEIAMWKWHGFTELRDSWAWAHYIHAFFAFHTAFQLSVLFHVMFRQFRKGNIWIGDAFTSISSSLLYRGVLVLISNQLNGFYTWTEYSLAIGYIVADIPNDVIYYRSDLILTDLLTLFLNVTTAVSYILKERVDPALAYASFALGFYWRVEQAQYFPTIRKVLINYAESNYELTGAHVTDAIDSLAPYTLNSVYHIRMSDRGPAIVVAILSVITGLVYVGALIFARKIHRVIKKRQASARRTDSYKTEGQERKRRYSSRRYEPETLFEAATGATLQRRFGIMTEYDNYVIIEGRRFATADAVYASGFVVANRKFLVARADLLSILIIKITRVRFKNVFVYDLVDADTPKQTARLVFPRTIEWSDLIRLDVSKLG